MPTCKECGDETDELASVTVAGKTRRVCESCKEQLEQNEQIAEESEAVVRNMMGFKGKR